MGLYVESVIPVQTLEKTDSGKIQRLKMQKKFVNGDYINLISKYCSADDDFKNETEKVDEVILDIWKKRYITKKLMKMTISLIWVVVQIC